MIIEIERNENNEVLEEGMVLISEDDDIHLIVETEDCFNVFDLEDNVLRCFDDEEDFESEYPTKKVYAGDEIKIILGGSKED